MSVLPSLSAPRVFDDTHLIWKVAGVLTLHMLSSAIMPVSDQLRLLCRLRGRTCSLELRPMHSHWSLKRTIGSWRLTPHSASWAPPDESMSVPTVPAKTFDMHSYPVPQWQQRSDYNQLRCERTTSSLNGDSRSNA